jgi:hypothetical protein
MSSRGTVDSCESVDGLEAEDEDFSRAIKANRRDLANPEKAETSLKGPIPDEIMKAQVETVTIASATMRIIRIRGRAVVGAVAATIGAIVPDAAVLTSSAESVMFLAEFVNKIGHRELN